MIIYYAGIISFIVSLILVFIFVFILINRFPKKTAAQVSGGIYKIRAKYFYILLIVVIISSYMALSNTPYPKKNDIIDAHVTVIGQKWLWHLHNGPYSSSEVGITVHIPLAKSCWVSCPLDGFRRSQLRRRVMSQ